jgi:hypothetical protein
MIHTEYSQPSDLKFPHLQIQPNTDQKYLQLYWTWTAFFSKRLSNSLKNTDTVNKYYHSIYVVLGIVSNLEMI